MDAKGSISEWRIRWKSYDPMIVTTQQEKKTIGEMNDKQLIN